MINLEKKINFEYKIQLRELIERFERQDIDAEKSTEKKVCEQIIYLLLLRRLSGCLLLVGLLLDI